MLKALVYKELRETGWIALIALLAYAGFAVTCAGHQVLPMFGAENHGVQFLGGSFSGSMGMVSFCFVISLAIRQTTVESSRGTWLFLLHRPLSRAWIVAMKLAVGLGLYLGCSAATILAYAAWAAQPGRHPSPFYWWMTADVWENWAILTLLYFGMFLTGIRPARWFGTRLLPLVAMMAISLFVGGFPGCRGLRLAIVVLIGAAMASIILYVAQTRDYS